MIDHKPPGFAEACIEPSGPVYLMGRYYDPQTGQFLSVDPMAQETRAPFEYASDDPVELTALPGRRAETTRFG